MELLPETLNKNGYFYSQIKRNEWKALYGQSAAPGVDPFAYEVFYIREQKPMETLLGGVKVSFEHKEIFPNNEEFGKNAWSIIDKQKALDFYNKMQKRDDN